MAIAKNNGGNAFRVLKGARGGDGQAHLPANPETERLLLGSILLEPAQWSACRHLRPADFYEPKNQLLFAAFTDLAAAGKPIDLPMLDEQLRANGTLADVGGSADVARLINDLAHSYNAPAYARTVLELACERETVRVSDHLTAAAYRAGGNVSDVIAEAQAALTAITERRRRADEETDGTDGSGEHAAYTPLHALTSDEAFPLETLPRAMRDLVLAASYAIPCPPDLVALPALVAAATAIGNSWAMRVKRGYVEPPIFYAAIVARPGDGKSPAIGYAMRPIRDRQEQESARHHAEAEAWKQKHEEERPPDAPKLTQRFTTDTTIEALADTLQDARSIVVVKDELHAWVAGMDAYKAKGRGSERDAWLSLWRAGQILINRRSREEPLYLHAPHVNVIGGIQEDRLPDLDDEQGRADGFLDRVVFAYPKPCELRYSEAEVDEETAHTYARLIDDLYGLPLASHPETGKSVTNYATFTPDGKDEYRAWCQALYAEMNDASFPMILRGVWMKLQAYAPRLALILHLCRSLTREGQEGSDSLGSFTRGAVDGVDVVHAVTLVEYFKRHARKVHARLTANPEDLRQLGALEWIKRQPEGKTTARDILHYHVGNVRDSDEARALLEELATHGWGAIANIPVRGGRISSVFTLKQVSE